MSDTPADTTPTLASVAPTPEPMPPRASPRARPSPLSMVLQVALIAVGVFLGLAGEEWREDRENRRVAADALRRLRVELEVNRESVARVKDYHAERLAELKTYFAGPVETRDATVVRFAGLRVPVFERAAYDLALATGSLANIDPELGFHLSRTYNYQNMANELGRGVMDAMYTKPPSDGDASFFAVLQLYYGDLGGLEPGLVEAYDNLIPAIDAELAQ